MQLDTFCELKAPPPPLRAAPLALANKVILNWCCGFARHRHLHLESREEQPHVKTELVILNSVKMQALIREHLPTDIQSQCRQDLDNENTY